MGEYVIVCGGRNFDDRDALFRFMDSRPYKIDLVVTGAARGADVLADEWAKARGVPRAIFPANWDGEGLAAGHRRNERMLDVVKSIHRVIAFPGGKGTESMVDKARRKGVKVTRFDPEIEAMLDE